MGRNFMFSMLLCTLQQSRLNEWWSAFTAWLMLHSVKTGSAKHEVLSALARCCRCISASLFKLHRWKWSNCVGQRLDHNEGNESLIHTTNNFFLSGQQFLWKHVNNLRLSFFCSATLEMLLEDHILQHISDVKILRAHILRTYPALKTQHFS